MTLLQFVITYHILTPPLTTPFHILTPRLTTPTRAKMAEAHAAVAFSFTVSHEGVHFNVNHDVLKAVWESGLRDWKKKFTHIKVSVAWRYLLIYYSLS